MFLVKKSFAKKFLTKIHSEQIDETNLINITEKECNYFFSLDKYKEFEKEIYNKEVLKEIVYKSIFLKNNIELIKLPWVEIKIYNQWKQVKQWYEEEFPIKFIYNSNNIEGSKIPWEEVEKIIKNKKYKYKVENEIKEVKNSVQTWNFINTKFIFNESNIKKLYHILTKNLLQENGNKYPRWFKKIENIVNNNTTTKPDKVSEEINSLIFIYKKNKKKIFSLKNAFDFHLKYEQIHPFENWNWRTWRFLMNKILLQNWMFPIIVFKENKTSYSNSISSCNSWSKKKYYKFMLNQYKKTIDEIYNNII